MADDGIGDVAALKIVIDAETEKFANGITVARETLAKFVGDGVPMVGKIDGIMAKLGDTVSSLPGKFAAVSSALGPIIAQATAAYELAKSIAGKMGVEGFDDVESAFGDLKSLVLTQSLKDDQAALLQSFETTRQKMATEAAGLATDLNAMGVSARNTMSLLADEIRKLAGAAETYFKGYGAASEKGLAYTEKFLEDQLAAARKAKAEIEAGGYDVGLLNRLIFGATPEAAAAKLNAQIDEITGKLQALQSEQFNRILAKLPTEIDPALLGDIDKRTESLRKQNFELEIQRATLGKTAAEAAKITEIMRAREALKDTPVVSTESAQKFDEELEKMARNKQAIENYGDAKRAAAERDRELAREERAINTLNSGMSNELEQLELKIRTMERGTEATAKEVFVQRQLAAARRANVELTPEDIAGIDATGDAYERLIQKQKTLQERLELIKQTNQAVSQSIMSEFSSWTRGAEFDVKRMTANILAELAKIAMQRFVLNNIFGGQGGGLLGGLLGGGMGGGGDYLAGYTNTLAFGGPREAGGAVETGKAYLVGEKGPELFAPSMSGFITPNHALGGMGGGNVVHLTIDARGATPDAVRELESRLPSIVIETMNEHTARTA